MSENIRSRNHHASLVRQDLIYTSDSKEKSGSSIITTPVRHARVSINGWDFKERVGSRKNAQRNEQ